MLVKKKDPSCFVARFCVKGNKEWYKTLRKQSTGVIRKYSNVLELILGLRCAGCIKKWNAFLAGITGICSTTIDIASSSVTVTYASDVIQLQNVCEAVLGCPGCVDALLISFKAVDNSESTSNNTEGTAQTKSTAVLSMKLDKSNICNIMESETELLSNITQEIVETIKQIKGVINSSLLLTRTNVETNTYDSARIITTLYYPQQIGARSIFAAAKKLVDANPGFRIAVDQLDPDTFLQEEHLHLKKTLLSCFIPAVVCLFLTVTPAAWLPSFFKKTLFFSFSSKDVTVVLSSLIVYCIGGSVFHKNAFHSLKKHSLTMEFLVSLSTSLTIMYICSFTLQKIIIEANEQSTGVLPIDRLDMTPHFFEMPALVITAILLGRFLESTARLWTSTSLHKTLLKQQGVSFCSCLINNSINVLPESLIELNDLLKIGPGEVLKHDGILQSKHDIYVDESLLSGESKIIKKKTGDILTAGCHVVSCGEEASATYKVTVIGSGTYLGRLEHMVTKVRETRPITLNMVDTVTQWFIPFVILFSLLTGFVWSFIFFFNLIKLPKTFKISPFVFIFQSMVAVLVVACPCALGLAYPTAITCGVARAARFGVLIRNLDALQTLSYQITDIIFDKTGTLTERDTENYTLYTIPKNKWFLEHDGFPVDISSEVFLVWCALSLQEKMYHHPFRNRLLAIWRELDKKNVFPTPCCVSSTVHPSEGVSGYIDFFPWISKQNDNCQLVNDQSWLKFVTIGNRKRMQQADVSLDDLDNVNPSIFVACNQKCLGYIDFVDKARRDALDLINYLQDSCKINVWICTGDTQERTEEIAKKLCIPKKFLKSQCSAEDKAVLVKSLLKKKNSKVIMIGDGINDSVGVTAASVGIALGTMAHLTATQADIVLINDSLSSVETLLAFAKYLKRKIYWNFIWAIMFNIVALPAAAGFFYPTIYLSPTWSGICMATSSIAVVSNSLSVLYVSDFTSSPTNNFFLKHANLFNMRKFFVDRKQKYKAVSTIECV